MCHDMGSACYVCFRHSRRVCRYFNVSEKRLWVFFLNEKNRIQYNDQCKKCVHECKQSFQCRIVCVGSITLSGEKGSNDLLEHNIIAGMENSSIINCRK